MYYRPHTKSQRAPAEQYYRHRCCRLVHQPLCSTSTQMTLPDCRYCSSCVVVRLDTTRASLLGTPPYIKFRIPVHIGNWLVGWLVGAASEGYCGGRQVAEQGRASVHFVGWKSSQAAVQFLRVLGSMLCTEHPTICSQHLLASCLGLSQFVLVVEHALC
jgi:hypothetical protein